MTTSRCIWGDRRSRRGSVAILLVIAVCLPAMALGAATFRISQKHRAFNIKELTIGRGDLVQFGNDDDFIHQIYVDAPDFQFDSAESQPGDTIDLRFTAAGTFRVMCHIHPKMLLVVTVR